MPVYHFNISGETDAEGRELENIDVAKCEALQMAGKILCEADSSKGWNAGAWTVTVSDPTGLMLFEMSLVTHEAPAISRNAFLAQAASAPQPRLACWSGTPLPSARVMRRPVR